MRKPATSVPAVSKTNNGLGAVDAYLAKVPEPARSTLENVRAIIRSAVPKATTEILSYGIPTFRYKERNVVAYAAFKNHCSLFPLQASLIDEMKDELNSYRTSKGTLQFPLDEPLPAKLLRKMVKARLAENDIRDRVAKR